MPSLQRELEVARRAALDAGRVILDIYATDFDVIEKDGGEGPVTQADRLANERIVDALRSAFPLDGIVAEESAEGTDARRFERCWFVDPLDGTRDFVKRNGEFAVQIGLAIGGAARLGVVYRPVGGRLYTGIVGEACVLENEGRITPLRLSPGPAPAPLRTLCSRSHASPLVAKVLDVLGAPPALPCGSVGVKVGLLAEGAADLYVHPGGGSSRWDSCAPEAILCAAGGVFTTFDGSRFRYDTRETKNDRGMLGAHPAVFPAALEAARRVLALQA